jgi:hypothetical protein
MNNYNTVIMLTLDIHVTGASELLECRPEMAQAIRQLSLLPAATILVLNSQGRLWETTIGAFFAPVSPSPVDNWDEMEY